MSFHKGRLAEEFYNDTYLSDQNACTSPRLVVWMGSKKKEAKEKAKLIDNKEIKDEDNQNITVTGSYKTILNLDKEYNKYLKHYYKNLGIDKNIQKKLSEDFTDKEILEANKDKELILTEIKEINNNAEKYCSDLKFSQCLFEITHVPSSLNVDLTSL